MRGIEDCAQSPIPIIRFIFQNELKIIKHNKIKNIK